MLMLLSVIPWSRLTNNTLKDFNLFGDLFPSEGSAAINTTSSIVDPELEAMMTQADGGGGTASDATPATAVADSTETDTCTLQDIETIEAPVIDGSVAIENYSGATPLQHFRQALRQAGNRTVRVAVIGDSYIEGDIFCSNLRDILQQRYGGSGVGFMAAHCEFPGFRQTVAQKSHGDRKSVV